MISIILSILLLIACIAIISLIIGKKLSVLASIDIETLPEERAKNVKNKIIAERIDRKLYTARKMLAIAASPVVGFRKNIGQKMGALHKGVVELRDKQRRAAVIGGATARSTEPQKQEVTTSLIEEAQSLVDAQKFDEAEKRYVDAIALDSNNLEAYEGLAELYCAQKEWTQAGEVFEYVCKKERDLLSTTNPEEWGQLPAQLAKHLYELAEIHQTLGNNEQSLEEITEAVSLDKNNPKLLDALVEIYINQKQRLRAERALEQFRRVNPENKKLEELEAKIRELPY